MQIKAPVSKAVLLTLVFSLFSFVGVTNAFADHKVATWLGGTGNWSDPTKWNIGEVPNNGVDTYDVVINSGSA